MIIFATETQSHREASVAATTVNAEGAKTAKGAACDQRPTSSAARRTEIET
jgi:hypothetical protein